MLFQNLDIHVPIKRHVCVPSLAWVFAAVLTKREVVIYDSWVWDIRGWLAFIWLSLRMLILGTCPPCCEEAQATCRGSSAAEPWPPVLSFAWAPCSLPVLVCQLGVSHVEGDSSSPQVNCPRWHHEVQRWVLPTETCPKCRSRNKKSDCHVLNL